MLRKVLIGLFVIGVIGAIAYGLRPQPVAVDFATVTEGPLQVTVDEEGKTKVRERYTVTAPITGQLRRIDLRSGDNVEAGKTVLAVIEASDPGLLDARAFASAQARVKAAEAAREQANSQIDKLKVAVAFAETELKRTKRAFENRGSSDAALNEAEMMFRTRTEEFKSAQFALQIAKFELEQARAALVQTNPATYAEEPARFEIPSPITGRVLTVAHESAGVVTPGTPLMDVGDPMDIEVVVEALSTDAVAVKPGAVVVLDHWGGEKPLEGRVRRIEPAAFTKVSALGVEEQRVNVMIDFVSTPAERKQLGHGYRVEARIVTWASPKVIKVASGAIFRHEGEQAVFRFENGKARIRPVTAGKANALETEIVEGLSVGDVVIAHPGDMVHDGVGVIARTK